jgi:hypothetical protein
MGSRITDCQDALTSSDKKSSRDSSLPSFCIAAFVRRNLPWQNTELI